MHACVLLLALASAFPENLSYSAIIRADAQFNGDYAAQKVADGVVPVELGKSDAGNAWAVKGETNREHAEISFEWGKPVHIAQVVYYGRTAWFLEECWKDYAIFADANPAPIAKGTLRAAHGPQRIPIVPACTAQRLRIQFTSSHGGLNPGASEIQIYSSVPSDAALQWNCTPASQMPWVDQVQPEALRALIERLRQQYGADYAHSAAHLRQLAKHKRLAALQREVLLFGVDKLVAIQRHEINASHVYTYHYEGFKPGGGLYVVDPRAPRAKPLELAAAPTGEILDCDLSYDGSTVLFSWRRTQDEGYHLWTVRVDGSELRQLNDGAWHDYNGCWLPDGGIAFLSTREAQFAYCWHAPVGVLHRMDADGGNVKKLSANYLNDFTPAVLNDGRLIFTRWEYVDRPAIPIQSLWTLHPDGTDLMGYFGNRVISPGTFMETRPIPGTEKIICTMTGHNGPTRGAIGIIDRRRGVNAQEAIENLTPDTPVPGVNEGNGNTDGNKRYSSPVPLDADRFLLSAQGPVLVRTYAGDCQSTVLPAPASGLQWFGAQPIRPRARPPVAAGAVCDGQDAVVYLEDVYQGLEPQVQRGEIKRLRIVREMQKTVRIDPAKRAFGFQFPVISCGATYAAKDVLGEVPVADDGSAYFRVPAGIPVYFMALDAQGRAVQRKRSFTHFMPGERQSCIGCHESRQHTVAARPGLALEREPETIEAPEWGRGGFSYTRVVQPVLDTQCVRCHGPKDRLDLSGDITDYFNVSYENLARDPQGPEGSPYVSWIPTYNGQEQNILKIAPKTWGSPASKLAEIVLNGHPDAQGRARVALQAREQRRILAWIDLNVPYYDTSETAHPDREGCRRIKPDTLDAVLNDVAQRRCTPCHESGKLPVKVWTRVAHPEHNSFLTAPMPVTAGGSGKCGKTVFASTDDPDYQAILKTFEPVHELLAKTPRMDMPNAKPAPQVCRDRK